MRRPTLTTGFLVSKRGVARSRSRDRLGRRCCRGTAACCMQRIACSGCVQCSNVCCRCRLSYVPRCLFVQVARHNEMSTRRFAFHLDSGCAWGQSDLSVSGATKVQTIRGQVDNSTIASQRRQTPKTRKIALINHWNGHALDR